MITEKSLPITNDPMLENFDYQQLNPNTREQIQALTTDIRNRLRRCALDIYQIGQDLCLIKQQLQHGQFRAWLKAEFDWSVSAANKFMQVSQQFQLEDLANVEIAPSALYALAAPSTPDEVRDRALAQAKQGKTITFSLAKQLIKENKHSEKDCQTEPSDHAISEESAEQLSDPSLPGTNSIIEETEITKNKSELTLLTPVYNASNFHDYLQEEWQTMSLVDRNLSVILCEVTLQDKKQVKSIMPQVMQQIAHGLAYNLKRTDDFVGQYNTEQCVAVLPHTDSEGAKAVADRFIEWLNTWKNNMTEDPYLDRISIRLGVASTVPDQAIPSRVLIRRAQLSLSEIE